MKWDIEIDKPQPIKQKASIRHETAVVTVEDSGDRRWIYFDMYLSHHSETPFDSLLTTWPREAIAKARAQLDALEAELDKCDEQ